MRTFRKFWCAAVIGATVVATALVPTLTTATSATAAAGGSVNAVFVATEWPNLDPALDNQAAADIDIMNAVYGQLFTETPSAGACGKCEGAGQIKPDLAKSVTTSPNGKLVTIHLRPGMKFSDGTPFNAAAVAFNIKRDLSPASICLCKTNFADVTSITTSGPTDVQLHLSQRYVPLLASFIASGPNWIMSPTAFNKEGASAFGQAPVGAGPFKVTKNAANSELDLVRNPDYFQKGQPVINSLKIVAVSSDTAALDALKAGTAQIVVGTNSPQVVAQAKQQFQVTIAPAIVISTVEFNNMVAPFNNIKAREAIAYATNPEPIIKELVPGLAKPVQAEVGPGSPYYEAKVPGTITYNLAKAKALVQQLGGLSFKFITLSAPFNLQVAEAEQSEWKQAGINMTITPMLLTGEVADFESGNWQALPGAAGGPDPDSGVQSLPSRFQTKGTFTCCADTALDQLIMKTTTTQNVAARQKAFDQAFAYINKNVMAVPVYAESYALLSSKSITNLQATSGGASEGIGVNWESIGVKQ
jgi:peptide/nickel transport system substrate-binding protein